MLETNQKSIISKYNTNQVTSHIEASNFNSLTESIHEY